MKLEVKRALLRLVEKLIYLFFTRPNIAYTITMVSQCMHDPRERHMQEVDKILHCLKSGPRNGLLFRKEDTLTDKIYVNAIYVGFVTIIQSNTIGTNILKLTNTIKDNLNKDIVVTTHVLTRLQISYIFTKGPP